jgi:hypothetical protein
VENKLLVVPENIGFNNDMPIDFQCFGLSILGDNTNRLIPRAWDWFIHDALGTSTITIIIGWFVFFAYKLLQRHSHTTQRQWRLEMSDEWRKSGRYILLGTVRVAFFAPSKPQRER